MITGLSKNFLLVQYIAWQRKIYHIASDRPALLLIVQHLALHGLFVLHFSMDQLIYIAIKCVALS